MDGELAISCISFHAIGSRPSGHSALSARTTQSERNTFSLPKAQRVTVLPVYATDTLGEKSKKCCCTSFRLEMPSLNNSRLSAPASGKFEAYISEVDVAYSATSSTFPSIASTWKSAGVLPCRSSNIHPSLCPARHTQWPL